MRRRWRSSRSPALRGARSLDDAKTCSSLLFGTTGNINMPNKTVTLPARKKVPRQPSAGNSQRTAIDAIIAPAGGPMENTEITLPRWRSGSCCDTNAIAFGVAAPKPRPLNRRNPVNAVSPSTNPVAAVAQPNRNVLAIKVLRCPTLSPIHPPRVEPAAIPTKAAANAGAKAVLVTSHSCKRTGVTKPSSWTSNPSNNRTQKIRLMARRCRPPVRSVLFADGPNAAS